MGSFYRNIISKLGRRGAFLLFLSLLDILIGFSLWTAEPRPLFFLTMDVWAGMWTAVGVVLFVQAFQKFDRIAYTLAAMLKFLWGIMYFNAWVFHGLPRGWVGATVWIAFGCAVLVVSSWPEDPRILIGELKKEKGPRE